MIKYFLTFIACVSSFAATPKIAGVAYNTNDYTVYPSSLVASNGFFNDTMVSIRDPRFAADPSGVLDSTTNIQYAINYAQTNGFKTIYIPSTTNYYRVTSQLTGFDNMVLLGDGYNSIIYQSSTSNISKNVMRIAGKTNLLIKGVHFKASGGFSTTLSDFDSSYCGLVLNSCTNSTVRECIFTGSAYAGLFIYKSVYVKALNNRFTDPGYSDPYVYQSQVIDLLSEDSSHVWIEGNYCVSAGLHPGDQGISTISAVSATNALATDITIINNEVGRKTEYGIMCYSTADRTYLRGNVSGNVVWGIDGSFHHLVASGITNSNPSIAITNVTWGTAAGNAYYMQNSLESSVVNNKSLFCGLFTRANGTLVKAAIGCSGAPEIQVVNNRVITNYYTGIALNNSGLFGDWTNRSSSFSGNTIIDSGFFVNTGTITNGTTNLFLSDMTLPLMASETNWAAGGFWRGDKIVIKGAGVAAADLETQIFAITNGIVQLTTNASTTVIAAFVTLSELSTTPPSALNAISVAATQRPLVANNSISKRTIVDNNRSGGIFVSGTSGADLMVNPIITGNSVKGGYNCIVIQNATGGLINGNSTDFGTINGIQGNNNVNRVLVAANSVRGSDVGILVNSLGGMITDNKIVSCTTGISSTQAQVIWNTFTTVSANYGNEYPTIDISGTNTTIVGISQANGAILTNSLNVGAGKFTVDSTGNPTKINNVTYSFPASQGGVSSKLQNDGSGNLTWGSGSSGDNWVASGSTNSTLPGVGSAYNFIVTNNILWPAKAQITSPADAIVELLDTAGTSFDRLQFGGTSASFPAIKRSSTTLEIKLANDSAYANINANAFSLGSGLADLGKNRTGLTLGSGYSLYWGSTTASSSTPDSGIARNAANIVRITDGSSGRGGLISSNLTVGAASEFTVSVAGDIVGNSATLANLTTNSIVGTYDNVKKLKSITVGSGLTYDGTTLAGSNGGVAALTNAAVYASGSVYSLTTSAALVDFGTTDPVLTIPQTGTYLITAYAALRMNGATWGVSNRVTIKLVWSTGPADVANSSVHQDFDAQTAVTRSQGIMPISVIFTATSGSTISLYASESADPSPGTMDIDQAWIVAIRLY